MIIPRNHLVGKVAHITDKDSIYHDEWGRIVDYDEGVYYIAIADDSKNQVIFDRDQFKVKK